MNAMVAAMTTARAARMGCLMVFFLQVDVGEVLPRGGGPYAGSTPARSLRGGASSLREAHAVLAVGPAPVLDDLAVADPQDGRAVDLDRLPRRLDLVERGAGVGALDGPVGD